MSKRVDDNQKAIVNGLRAVGCHVQSLATIGRGCPDILASYRNSWYVAEIKDGSKFASQQKLTPAEVSWHNSAHAPVHVWTSLAEALAAIGAKSSLTSKI